MHPFHVLPPHFFKIYSSIVIHLCLGLMSFLFIALHSNLLCRTSVFCTQRTFMSSHDNYPNCDYFPIQHYPASLCNGNKIYILCTGTWFLTIITRILFSKGLNLKTRSQTLTDAKGRGSGQLQSDDPARSKWKTWRMLKLKNISKRHKIWVY
jgi:hypothetical protein